MHRIDTDGAIDGRFSDGDATGPVARPGTVVGADWLNDVQENICSVIESQDGVLVKGDPNALRVAIEKAIKSAIELATAPIYEKLTDLDGRVGPA